ncbi:restriction endonuclease [Clostridium sp. 'deep sea']|uniref:restriction endonuclease n=1 Tax=Clostridium sp. 'deep sea' TaxID=2779445 RepID=UPI0018967298|nr:restriction endonuclease [Clostridium sp. 'deep sea']QOR36885.1 restriction endonuclease [Clostridium sp. 'deep sea']
MRDYQARGYILESVVWKILSKFGYIEVASGNIRGRGAEHQIDAYGLLSFPTAFIYRIRLICECKYYKRKIQLHNIRNFVGVVKDISENYFTIAHHNANSLDRYNDAGCFFSASEYTIDAQEYAWAQNIFLVSFYRNPFLEPILERISQFAEYAVSRKSYLENATKQSVVDDFWQFTEEERESNKSLLKDYPSVAMGILDDNYPVALVGEDNWLNDLDALDNNYSEIVEAIKSHRVEYETETAFHLHVKAKYIVFTLPNAIANRVINRIDLAEKGNEIFTIDIPYIKEFKNEKIRRFIKIKVHLPDDEKYSYLNKISKCYLTGELND